MAVKNVDPLISFEEFSARGGVVSNNLFIHFYGAQGDYEHADLYREKQAFVACMTHHKDEFETLRAKLEEIHTSQIDKRSRAFLRDPDYLKLLYRAYELMHPYADSNGELFK